MVFMTSLGCMKIGPDFTRPDTEFKIPAAYQHTSGDVATRAPDEQWWRIFNDPELTKLADTVLCNNLDIKEATARILEIQSYFVQSRADRYPAANLEAEVRRQRIVPGVEADYYNLSLPASFELDLWGRLARTEEAARADLLQAEDNARTVAHTVVAEAITLYLEIESLERRIQITDHSVQNYRRNLALVERRYEGGLTSVLDLRQSRRILAQAEANLPQLRQELGAKQQQLAVLAGKYPTTQPPRLQPDEYFTRLDPVPPGLPSELLLQRPDITAAEANLRALNARIGVATASRFPRIALTGSFGYASAEFDELFNLKSNIWNIALGFTQPLFDAGKLKAGQKAAEARYRQGLAQYVKTVLTAFADVERALLTRRQQLEKRKRILNFLTEARATQQVAESRYERGLVDYLVVLDAQQTRFQAEENLVLVDLAIMSNRVALHRALGGGWTDPPTSEKGES